MENILKVRDDHEPTRFTKVSEASNAGDAFQVEGESSPHWVGTDKKFGLKELRARIEPWLTALFQSEHLSLLAGSGLTHAVHHAAAGSSAAGMNRAKLSIYADKIDKAAEQSAKKCGRADGNIEDQLRAANEVLRGLEILQPNEDDTVALRNEIRNALKNLATEVLKSETTIATSPESKREHAFALLVTFLMSFASRSGVRDRLNIFTTNYDRLIESGAEIAGLHLLDRFLGNLTPIFRSSRLEVDMHYNPPGIRGEPRYLEGVARFTKLHGSVDWIESQGEIRRIGLPFGAGEVTPFLNAPGFQGCTERELMIYPNAAKDRETSLYPYIELFRDLAAALCRPNSTLVTYGYSFGDDHINRVIRDMLTIPSTHLVVISYSDPLGRIIKHYTEIGRPSQISLLIGPELANLETLTTSLLPKAAIDRTTFRMAELLKHRFGATHPGRSSSSASGGASADPDSIDFATEPK
jgi:hypothetical protein